MCFLHIFFYIKKVFMNKNVLRILNIIESNLIEGGKLTSNVGVQLSIFDE